MKRLGSLIIFYAVSLHFVWAACLLGNVTAANATAVHTLLAVVPVRIAIFIYIVVALLALWHSFFGDRLWKAAFLLPQQFVLMISAGGAAYAMWLGQFADGVQRTHEFVIADQCPAVIGAVLHTVAIFRIIRGTEH